MSFDAAPLDADKTEVPRFIESNVTSLCSIHVMIISIQFLSRESLWVASCNICDSAMFFIFTSYLRKLHRDGNASFYFGLALVRGHEAPGFLAFAEVSRTQLSEARVAVACKASDYIVGTITHPNCFTCNRRNTLGIWLFYIQYTVKIYLSMFILYIYIYIYIYQCLYCVLCTVYCILTLFLAKVVESLIPSTGLAMPSFCLHLETNCASVYRFSLADKKTCKQSVIPQHGSMAFVQPASMRFGCF